MTLECLAQNILLRPSQLTVFAMQSIEHLRYYGGWADKIYGALHTPSPHIALSVEVPR